jgi:hypothetical protein
MNLLELIKYFKSGGKYEAFCLSRSLNTDSEVIDIYPLGVIKLFDF